MLHNFPTLEHSNLLISDKGNPYNCKKSIPKKTTNNE